ncbi:MAG: hypothetical protein IKN11_11360 [Bacteroidales bacterium]|nr:hypothetical protein [Bacteroidales bacterium]
MLRLVRNVYDDIAVTDNYVVASAHADGTNNIMLRVLNKPLLATYASSSPVPVIISNNNIFYSCSLGSSGCDIYGYVGYNFKKAGSHGEYPIFLTRTQGDHVVLSCMAASTTGEYGITVKDIGVTSGVPNVYKELCSWWGTSFVPGWNLRDVRYNNNNDTILVLVDRESPLDGQVSSGVGKVDNAMFMSCIFTFPLSPMILHSVDKFFSRGVGSLPWYFLSHWMICSGSFDIPLCTTPALWSNNKMDDVCSRHLFKEIDMNTGKMTLFSLPQIEPKLIYCYQEHIQNTIVTIGELQSKCEGD